MNETEKNINFLSSQLNYYSHRLDKASRLNLVPGSYPYRAMMEISFRYHELKNTLSYINTIQARDDISSVAEAAAYTLNQLEKCCIENGEDRHEASKLFFSHHDPLHDSVFNSYCVALDRFTDYQFVGKDVLNSDLINMLTAGMILWLLAREDIFPVNNTKKQKVG